MRPSSSFLCFAACLSLAGCSSSSAPSGGGKSGASPSSDSGAPVVDAGTQAIADAGGGPSLVIEPDQGMNPIYGFMSSATKTLDMTMYELTDPQITTILTQAVKNGVTVRVILDQNQEQQDNTTAYDALSAAGVQMHWANPTYAVTHQKTITIDGKTSAIMTLNMTPEDYPTSRDFAVITSDANDVAAIETTFDADFTNATITPPTGDDLVWSPTNSESTLLDLIKNAKTSLLVENEEMSDTDVVEALVTAAKRGVDVRVAMENSKDYVLEFNALVLAGVKLATYSHGGLYIHAKVIVCDYGTATSATFVGSENFSNASLTENRELGLVTSNPVLVDPLETALASDFAGGKTYTMADASAGGEDAGPGDDAGAGDSGDAATSDATAL